MQKKQRGLSGLIFFLVLILAKSLSGQNLSGQVWGSEGPLAGASWTLLPQGWQGSTDAEGSFEIALPSESNGGFWLLIEAEDYHAYAQHWPERPAENLEIHLLPRRLDLEAVELRFRRADLSPLRHSLASVALERKSLEREASLNFVQALQSQAGLQMIQTGVGISKPVLRGFSANRLMINDRGIKQEGQQWGLDHGLEIDPFVVETVEIVKGPASLIYGSEAMAGAININPVKAPLPERQAQYQAAYRSLNQALSQSLSWSDFRGKWGYGLRMSHQDYGDYQVPAQAFSYAGFRLPIPEGRLNNTAGQERHFQLEGAYRDGENYSLLEISRFQQKVGLFPGAVGIPTAYALRQREDQRAVDLPRQEISHWKVISNSRWKLGRGRLEADVAYQYNQREERSFPHAHGLALDPNQTKALGLDLQTYTANLRWVLNPRSGQQEHWGVQGQWMQNQPSGFEYLVPQFRSSQLGFYYHRSQSFGSRWEWNGGLRYDLAQHRIREKRMPSYINNRPVGPEEVRTPALAPFYQHLSGGLGLQYRLSGDWLARLNLGSSFRMPTAVELGINGVHHGNFRHEIGNAALQPERGYQLDFSLDYEAGPWTLALSPFINYYQDFIYLAPSARFSSIPGSGQSWEYRQNRVLYGGGEIWLRYQILPALHWENSLEWVRNQNLDSQLPLPLTPPFSGLSGLEYEQKLGAGLVQSLFARLRWRYRAAQNRVDRNERVTPQYHLWSAQLGLEMGRGRHRWRLSLSGENLADRFYLDHLSRYRLLNLPEPGRNISLQLSWNW